MLEITEEWRPVVGHEGSHEVSSHGRVRSIFTYQMCAQRLLKGYPGVTINGAPRSKRLFTVHSLVAAAFIGLRPQGQQINHKDGVKTNNYWQNLEYVTCRENIHHSCFVLGNIHYGTDNQAAKLTPEKVIQIRAEYIPRKNGAHRLARKFGVTKRMILNIIHRKNWTAV